MMESQIVIEGSLQSADVEATIADLDDHVAQLDEVKGNSEGADVRDKVLLSLTSMQNAVGSQRFSVSCHKVETLEKLFRLIDCCDALVSYGSSQLIKKIAVLQSCQDMVRAALVHQWSEMLSFRCMSALGVLHRIEILCDLFSKKLQRSSSVGFSTQGVMSVIGRLVVEQWEEFLAFVFESISDEIRQSHLYHNIIVSTCSLWIKLIRREVENSSVEGSSSTEKKIFCRTDVLLDRLKTGSLSAICHRKCLSVLLECLPYSSFLSPMKVIPSLYHKLAWRNIFAFKICGVDDVNKDNISGNFQLGTNWIRRCATRSSISQGFGGYCNLAESICHNTSTTCDSGVTVEGENTSDWVMEIDETVLRKLFLLLLTSLAIHVHSSAEKEMNSLVDDDIWLILDSMESLVCSLLLSNQGIWLMRLFDEQDDDLCEALLCLLDIYILTGNHSRLADVNCKYEPCRFFLQFLERGFWDHTLLLDLLMSPETCFLIYLTRLLKHILSDWDHWVFICRKYDKEANDVGAADMELRTSKDFSSCDKSTSSEEFRSSMDSVKTKEISVERLRPVDSLKQLEENYTSPLFLQNSNEKQLKNNIRFSEITRMNDHLHKASGSGYAADPGHCSSVLCGSADTLPGNSSRDIGNRSQPKGIIDYSDSGSDDSENTVDERALKRIVATGKSDSSKCEKYLDEHWMDPDGCVNAETSGTCLTMSAECIIAKSVNSSRIANEFDAESGQKLSSMADKCHALNSSEYYSFRTSEQFELSSSSESQMDVESVSSKSAFTDDDLAKTEREETGASVGVLPENDPANEREKQCEVLVNAMTTLIRLRLCLTRLISKDMFPYSVCPLEKLLKSCEEMYEEV